MAGVNVLFPPVADDGRLGAGEEGDLLQLVLGPPFLVDAGADVEQPQARRDQRIAMLAHQDENEADGKEDD